MFKLFLSKLAQTPSTLLQHPRGTPDPQFENFALTVKKGLLVV